VAGQPTVRYDDIVHAIDIAKSAGVHGVGIVPKDLSSR
jgi:biopolymer transport protein ExbD